MDKETLSNYGWIVILVLILAVMLALATPFGTFIAGAIKSTTAGLFNVNQTALGSAGIDVDDLVFENCDHLETELRNVTDTYTGDTCCKNCGKVMATGETIRPKIPEGGVYYVGVTSTDTASWEHSTYTAKYVAGDEFPETVNMGDVYHYGDYEYRYNQYYFCGSTMDWYKNTSQGGWGVDTRSDSKTTYGEILSSINGQPVNTLKYTFGRCRYMTESPIIPNTITDMANTFYNCTSLKIAPEIPNSVTNMGATFEKCSSLTTAPVIPNGVTNMYGTFQQCTSLKTYAGNTDPDGDFSNYDIPNTATSLMYTFSSTAIEKPPVIKNGVTSLQGTFSNCQKLKTVPTIPSSVTNMDSTFNACSSATGFNKIVIPAGVTELRNTFSGCASMTDNDTPTMHNNITNLYYTFSGCVSLSDLSSLTIPNAIKRMEGTFMDCTSLVIAPTINHCSSLEDISSIFRNCTKLTTSPLLPSKVNDMGYAFYGCTSLTDDGMPDISKLSLFTLDYTFYGCTSLVNLEGYRVDASAIRSLSTDYMFAECTSLVSAPTFTGFPLIRFQGVFKNCTSLTGTITIDIYGTTPSCGDCFAGVDFEKQNITLAGSYEAIDTFGATGTNYCAECNGKCQGNH